ncbi:hypothetical protein ASE00_15095 [Sphingomonas sp. Root710]|uniref:glycosyltransferase family 25 protein n=1 Tax=Sphingomonas sp. Root710 TaxID=1736594 RepID=UPI0006F3364B|nr:glycosyltransferase family 25 protein [Sphingomonas sp. Root710]KRB81315.1 hypothetical protein ASE00_15095 [Sphingomonas sp. Root710]
MQRADIRGFYINLDRSPERRALMEEGLARCGLGGAITRFSARQGDDRPKGISANELGCFLSHQAIVDSIADDRPTLILEDDIYFPPRFEEYLSIILEKCAGHEWDILFLNKMISFTDMRAVYQMIRKKRAAGDIYSDQFRNFSIEECKGLYISGAGAYLIRPGAAGKVAAILRKTAEDNYPKPVDITYLNAINAGTLKAKFAFPYILGVHSQLESTLKQRAGGDNGPLFNDILNLFVAGGDIDRLRLGAFDAVHDIPFDADAFIASQILYRRLTR